MAAVGEDAAATGEICGKGLQPDTWARPPAKCHQLQRHHQRLPAEAPQQVPLSSEDAADDPTALHLEAAAQHEDEDPAALDSEAGVADEDGEHLPQKPGERVRARGLGVERDLHGDLHGDHHVTMIMIMRILLQWEYQHHHHVPIIHKK